MTLPLKLHLIRQRSKECHQSSTQSKQTLHTVLRDAIESAIHELEDFTITSPQQSKRIEEAARRAVQSLNLVLCPTASSGPASPTRQSISDFSWSGSDVGRLCDDVDGTFFQILTQTKERYRSKPSSPAKRAVIHALAHLKGLCHQSVGSGTKKSVIVSRRSSIVPSPAESIAHGDEVAEFLPLAHLQPPEELSGNDFDAFLRSAYEDFVLYDQPAAGADRVAETGASSHEYADRLPNMEIINDMPAMHKTGNLKQQAASPAIYDPSIWSSGESFLTDAEQELVGPNAPKYDDGADMPHATDPDWNAMNKIAMQTSLPACESLEQSEISGIHPRSKGRLLQKKPRRRFAGCQDRLSFSSSSSFSNYVSGGETLSGNSSLRSPSSFGSLNANLYSLPQNFYVPKPQMIEESATSQIQFSSSALDVGTRADLKNCGSSSQAANGESSSHALKRRKRQKKEDDAFPCAGCARVFSRACDRNKHQKAHAPQDTLPYSCTMCNKAFRYPKDLRRHQRTHGAEESPEELVADKSLTHGNLCTA